MPTGNHSERNSAQKRLRRCMFMGRLNGIKQYNHGISRRYLFFNDEGRAYEALGKSEFREIFCDEGAGRVEERLKALGETLELRMITTTSVARKRCCKRLVLSFCGFGPRPRTGWHSEYPGSRPVAGGLRMR